MSRTIKAPRGSQRTCLGWEQEAAMRMLMNNLDPEVAERPEDLVVYGGTGKAARSSRTLAPMRPCAKCAFGPAWGLRRRVAGHDIQ